MKPIIHCPYCNASVALPEGDLRQARLRCPRCGDNFPNRYAESPDRKDGESAPEIVSSASPLPARRPSNALVARVIVGVMLCVAAGTVTFALSTVPFRRANDPHPPGPRVPTDVPMQTLPPVPPAELTALGLLPADCNFVAGLNVAGMLDQAEGKELLQHLPPGVLDLGLRQLANWSSLKVDNFEHVVVGLRFTNQLPQVFVIAQTGQPYDLKVLAQKLAPAVADRFRGRPVYRLQQPHEGLLWCHSDRTLVLVLNLLAVEVKDLEAIPTQARQGTEGLLASVREDLEKRLSKDSFLWLAGDLSQTVALKELLKLASWVPPSTQDVLLRLRSFSIGVRVQKGLTLTATLAGATPEDAAQLVAWLRERKLEGADSFAVVGSPPQPDPADAGSDRRVMLQAQFSGEALRQFLQSWAGLLKKPR